eukprot:NODE_13428_length_1166_cov_11.306064.p1 GENE.NODE_13428_length_1166_cov_11.306064~~NODE_13428_length_1166_cov_11.306064.p1  ORF type:complete len:184 (-),score=50.27 NODE_13428_length_1166_cov_11.306064:215-766(-)
MPARSAAFAAKYLHGELVEPSLSGDGTCRTKRIVRFHSEVGIPYEMWWEYTNDFPADKSGAMRSFEKYLVALHGNLSTIHGAHSAKYDQYMDFHVGLWYDEGDTFLDELTSADEPFFTKGQAVSGYPNFFIEGPEGQIYEMQALRKLEREIELASFDLCQMPQKAALELLKAARRQASQAVLV